MSEDRFFEYYHFVVLLAVALSTSPTVGQVKNFGETGAAAEGKIPTSIVQLGGIPLESTIDPDLYFVGPSDGIAVNIWTSPPLNFNLTVTPEGTLIVPTIGEVRISDLKLSDAKKKILAEVRKKYISAEATVTLTTPRQIVVTVTGNVLSPGSLVVRATDRTNTAIQEASKSDQLSRDRLVALQKTMSKRNITLKRRDGLVHHIDLVKFYATKEDSLNPYLREGDIIFVPATNFEKNVIGVYGEVNSPDRYEYVEGDSITDAIKIAYGMTVHAIADSVELSKLDSTAEVLFTTIVNVQDILDKKAPNMALNPGDRIVVKARPDFRRDYRVRISGEVVYPGTYPVTKNKTRLSEIVRHAGGFTEYAALRYAVLSRRSISPQDIEIERLMSSRGSVSPEDSAYYHLETNLRLNKELVDVDFEKLFVKHDSTQDVLLQSEDEIYVPSTEKTVYVFGEVVLPGHVPFVAGQDPQYYIRKAGGFADQARSGDVKVIKSNTKQWLDPGQTTIDPGDYVWVPREPYRPFPYYTAIARDITSFIGALTGLAILIATLRR
ncbi:MAG: SLBB domain-containing protein [Bacteroidota bacterium]